MEFGFVVPSHDKASAVGRSVAIENAMGRSVWSEKHNRCVLFPPHVPLVANSIERIDQNLTARTNSPSDLIIQIGESRFHLHKLAMVSRSEYLNRLVFQRRNNTESDGNCLTIQMDNVPGGTKNFELVVKFCYGWKVDLAADNVAALCCAAHLLEMSDNLAEGNLISKTQAFLNFILLFSWKDTLRIFKSCESITPWAKEFLIVKRCSEAIACKVLTSHNTYSMDIDNGQSLILLACKEENKGIKETSDNWWLEDVSFLRIDHFVEVVESIKRKGMRSDLVGSCIAHWTMRWLTGVSHGLEKTIPKEMSNHSQRVTTECLIRILPTEENSVSSNFLLHLLKAGLMLKINPESQYMLERRLAFTLEQCGVADLLVKNYGNSDATYDVHVVTRVLECYVSCMLSKPAAAKLHVISKLVDGYLVKVARDDRLTLKCFRSLVEVLPESTRHCYDNLYRAIDMYFKAHPNLTEEERMSVCRVLEYHKLSVDARQHVMQNDRLPLKVTTQFILLEQVNMARSMTRDGSNFHRTNSQKIIRVSKNLGAGKVYTQEIKSIRKQVEMLKVELNKLQLCKLKLRNQLKVCTC